MEEGSIVCRWDSNSSMRPPRHVEQLIEAVQEVVQFAAGVDLHRLDPSAIEGALDLLADLGEGTNLAADEQVENGGEQEHQQGHQPQLPHLLTAQRQAGFEEADAYAGHHLLGVYLGRGILP